tara:strand:+ start:233 stop:1471 length:1239 start_codon:yes stop_codon:yes gene_type:complete
MAIKTDVTKLSDEFTKQITEVVKKAAGKHPYLCELKKQTSQSTLIHIFYMDRDDMRAMVGTALKKNGMNFATGKGYVLRRKNFSSGTFYGWEYDALQEGDTKPHKIQLRFKVLSEGKRKRGNKGGKTEKKENKGILFEKDLSKDLKVFSETGDPKHTKIKYKDFMKSFMEDIGCSENAKRQKCLNEIIDMGALNQKRSLVFSGKDIFVGGRDTNIGHLVTDITINIGCDKKDIYMSLKYGNTVTFVNSGVKTLYTDDQFKAGKITDTKGLALLDLFGVDAKKFITVFAQAMKFGGKKVPRGPTEVTKNVEVVTNKVDKRRLHQFIETCVGWGYWLVHLSENGKVDYFQIKKQDLKRITTPRSVVVLYPKASHPSKRIDVIIDTPKFELKMNLRNKQAGILPTHIMLDYKIKH